ncbi:hypothetical protein D3C80_1123330 [compost metagenome]
MPQGIVGVAEIVQVQVAERDTAPIVLRQARGKQRLEALAVGDAGQWILLGQSLQGGLQHAALAHMAQAATQGIDAQRVTHQPVADTRRPLGRFMLEQHHHGQIAASWRWLQLGCRQQYGRSVLNEQAANRLPGRGADQNDRTRQRSQALAQHRRPLRPIGQKQQTQRFDRRGQACSLGHLHDRWRFGIGMAMINH